MDSTSQSRSSSSRLLRSPLSFLSQDWLTLFLDLYHLLRQWLNRHRHEGVYEILDYDSTLELKDPKGETAIFKRQQRVKFLQDYIMAFQDYVWGEGDPFADYQVSPGVLVDKYQEGDQWNLLVSLRETRNAGDITDFHTERTIKHGFVNDEEWWQVEIRHRTRQFKLSIIFPKKRRCRRAVLIQRTRQRTAVLGPEHFTDLPDGRQGLTWETKKLRRFETYTIKWWW
jgi:hypothetical protein